eukprot:g7905.t1
MKLLLCALVVFVSFTYSSTGRITESTFSAFWPSPNRRSLTQFVEETGARFLRPSCTFQGPFPYLVSIRGANGEHRCVGTLVSPTTVLTAASCVDPRAGLTNIATRPVLFIGGYKTDEPIDIRQTCTVSFAPGWFGNYYHTSNLALLTFSPASCVFPAPFIGQGTRNASLYMTGYGREGTGTAPFNEVKTIANMTEISRCNCAPLVTLGKLQYQERCFRSPDCDCAAACEGDEGAPIIAVENFRTFTDRIIAVVSYTEGNCSSSNSAAISTDLNPYRIWIESFIKKPPAAAEAATQSIESGR